VKISDDVPQGGFYPPASVIDRETARNDAAIDLLLSYADCVPRIIGGHCPAQTSR
jgi:carboxypeptidase T